MNSTLEKISAEDWHYKQKSINIPKSFMNQIVLNFFIVEGYRDAAIEFSKEADIPLSNQELDQMIERIEIKKNILDGDIDSALEKVNKKNNNLILFKLKTQKLIELIKKDQIDQAVKYAQTEIIPLLPNQPHLIEEIEQAIALIAFSDIKKSPMNHLVQNSQRIKVASEINQHLYQDSMGNDQAKLRTLMKLLLWAQEILKCEIQYPQLLEISKGQFSKEE
ncbi:unnamed protein product (macronuclear) [Paramecium tetraurelia]|uniref:CTLH domain-containing protein n=1 Tax=Paramecium tetraurelia TaxID=5888 RepID=A0DGB4_PARTE|nr:uncharacterized protein GSPATT00002210001 [Paramecium tetraurelia]CAK82081.1 unnamed protein product [Paramecium tetraurelia]|eukprot:XP_001449478.1 hypothetical protein (macronuclear) [Paramecium tetraurelia strain d4-2]